MTLDVLDESLLGTMHPDKTVKAEIVPFLASHHLMPQVLSELIVDQALATIECTPDETEQACEAYYQTLKLTSPEQRDEWRSHYRLTQAHLEQLATRGLRIEKFKRTMWLNKVESYFLKRKRQLDRVIYSILRTCDRELAIELFFRIQEEEQSFADLAHQFSEGPEQQTGGLIGPVEFGGLAPNLADMLYAMPAGQLNQPVTFGEWHAIIRVEQRLPVQLDEAMVQRLLNEKFEAWFQEQLRQLTPHEQAWMGV